MDTAKLTEAFTSTGSKFFHHPTALEGLRNGHPHPVTSHIMLTDRCNHTCAFCSVATREGNALDPSVIIGYVMTLKNLGLKAVILSGGGNPILYKHKVPDRFRDGTVTHLAGSLRYLNQDWWDFNDVVNFLHAEGLEIGVITNGMPLVNYPYGQKYSLLMADPKGIKNPSDRMSWKTVWPETLDKCTWIRISMSGLDHKENEVYVPDIDPDKTTLGFSYVAHDIYEVPEEPNHGKVSTKEDLEAYKNADGTFRYRDFRKFEDRIPNLTRQIADVVRSHKPRYVRLLPNCLEVDKIKGRCDQLQAIADAIDPSVVFVQYKPPDAPPACYLGYLHPVLNSDGFVYPCDSCVLNKAAGHKFAEPWRMCRWDEIGNIYAQPARSLIKNPAKQCPGCVFTKSNLLLQTIVDGAELQPGGDVQHPNFV